MDFRERLPEFLQPVSARVVGFEVVVCYHHVPHSSCWDFTAQPFPSLNSPPSQNEFF